jgi:hypothetical protein
MGFLRPSLHSYFGPATVSVLQSMVCLLNNSFEHYLISDLAILSKVVSRENAVVSAKMDLPLDAERPVHNWSSNEWHESLDSLFDVSSSLSNIHLAVE